MAHNPDDNVRTESAAELLLILGRDREAIAAATRDSYARAAHDVVTQGAPMDGVRQLDEIMPMLIEVVDQITPDQLENPTACADFTVSSVLNHMITGARWFAPAFRGDPSPTEPPVMTAEAHPAQFRRAMEELLDAMHSPGAQERTIAAPFGEVPGSLFARYTAFDGLVHGWDLATATGRRYAPREELVAEVAEAAHELLQPEMRDGDTFADETTAPSDANQLERLVAFSGRQLPTKETSP